MIGDTWIDEEGNELQLPSTIMDDQNWSSHRGQDFWHDIDAARTHEVPADDLWGTLGEDDDTTPSESNEHDNVGRKMPGFIIPESESNDFAPYPSKTVSSNQLASE